MTNPREIAEKLMLEFAGVDRSRSLAECKFLNEMEWKIGAALEAYGRECREKALEEALNAITEADMTDLDRRISKKAIRALKEKP